MGDPREYIDKVTQCLLTFQYIEEALKQNLVRLNALIYLRIKKYVPYDLKPIFDSIGNTAMGRLIELYKIYCNDNELISDLRKSKGHRDAIAHQGLLMTVEDMKDPAHVNLKISELQEIEELAQKSFNKLLKSWEAIEKTLNQLAAEQRDQADPGESSAGR